MREIDSRGSLNGNGCREMSSEIHDAGMNGTCRPIFGYGVGVKVDSQDAAPIPIAKHMSLKCRMRVWGACGHKSVQEESYGGTSGERSRSSSLATSVPVLCSGTTTVHPLKIRICLCLRFAFQLPVIRGSLHCERGTLGTSEPFRCADDGSRLQKTFCRKT